MEKSYPDWRENISTRQIVLFCSYGTVFPVSGKVFRKLCSYGTNIFRLEISPINKRDLAYQQARSRLTGKRFVSYERKVTFHTIFLRRRNLACKVVEMFSR